jgi:hypothetical protein
MLGRVFGPLENALSSADSRVATCNFRSMSLVAVMVRHGPAGIRVGRGDWDAECGGELCLSPGPAVFRRRTGADRSAVPGMDVANGSGGL